MFTEKDFTPAQREEDESLIGGMFDQIVGAVSHERGMNVDQVHGLIDRAPLNADAALKAKLVERLEYEDQFDERIKHHGGSVHKTLEFTDYTRPSLLAGFGAEDQIAVIYCDGEIVRGQSRGLGITGGTVSGSDELAEAFKKAREDASIRAVIFRVDSPGGSVIGSELIRHAAERTAAKKPVVVSMSGYAASGGYWVSTPAARILAEPGTITGSIGVVGGKFNISPAAQKIYLNSGPISRGANFEMFDEFTDFTPAQAKFFQEQMLGDSYQKFLKVVANSRHMSVEDVDRIAQGRVWTGQQAHEIKLVDELGGFAEALADAKKMAKIPADREVALVELPVQPGVLERILGGQAMASAPRLPSAIRTMAPALSLIRAALSHGGSFNAAYCPVAPVL
jgi:protease-4